MKRTIEEIIARLKELQQDDDIEGAHIQADWIICNLLEDLGYRSDKRTATVSTSACST